jgi:nicotinamidase-related amidase
MNTRSEKWDAAALLVIDVQQGLFQRSNPIYKAKELLENINTLVKRAHGAGIPVFYIQHANKGTLVQGSDEWQLHPQMQPVEVDFIIHKRHGNAFKDTTLGQELESRQINRLVATGLLTNGCVKATCIAAQKLGYEVILVQDGHSNFNRQAASVIEEWHRKLGNGIVELRSTGEIDFN